VFICPPRSFLATIKRVNEVIDHARTFS
jgi:hypothetical protein